VTTIGDVFALWRAAEQPTVMVTRLPWPELEAVTNAAIGLRPSVERSTVAAEMLRGALSTRQLLSATPLPPNDGLAGISYLVRRINEFLEGHPGHSLDKSLRALQSSLVALLASSSIVGEWFANVLSEYGEDENGTPEAVVVVPRRAWVQAVRAWLHKEELTCADVMTPGDLRQCCTARKALILAGHPSSSFSSGWKAPDVAIREHGWLFTAPPAGTIRLALTADAPLLDEAALWLAPSQDHPILAIEDHGPRRETPSSHQWVTNTFDATFVRRTPRQHVDTDDGVPAIEVVTASRHSIFFNPELGPRRKL
jgi:hypothetical protein